LCADGKIFSAAKNRSLRRGVKEVVKALRKSGSSANAIVILAADISPMDVISHIPVLCEDHSVAYMFVTSRAELGAASLTKRPTSVVMLVPTAGEKKKKKKKGAEEIDAEGEETVDTGFKEAYDELLRLVEAELRGVAV
jgi:H/ACA ribonucleoprotein complex subunit 2